MKSRCFSPDQIASVLRLGEDSPERRHIEDCPRCRGLLLTYREFVEDKTVPLGADLQDAGERLRSEFYGSAIGSRKIPPRVGGFGILTWARGLIHAIGRRSVLIPVTAAVLVFIGLYSVLQQPRDGAHVDALRGPSRSVENGTRTAIVLLPTRPYEPDGIELRWRRDPDATSYEVTLFGGDLEDLARFGPQADTTCVVRRADLHGAAKPGVVVGWQVRGLKDGVPVATSPVGAARIP